MVNLQTGCAVQGWPIMVTSSIKSRHDCRLVGSLGGGGDWVLLIRRPISCSIIPHVTPAFQISWQAFAGYDPKRRREDEEDCAARVRKIYFARKSMSQKHAAKKCLALLRHSPSLLITRVRVSRHHVVCMNIALRVCLVLEMPG